MKNYRDLEIYELAYALAIKCHKLSLRLPKYECYETGAQLRRSSKSIAANIVEGYGRKKYKAEFVKFLIYAHASCDETILHISFLADTHQAFKEDLHNLLAKYDKLGGKINRFIRYVETSWK